MVVLFWAQHLRTTGCSCLLHHGLLLRRRLRLEKVAQADQVVSDHRQAEHSTEILVATQFELAQSAERLLLRRSLWLDASKHPRDAASGIDPLVLPPKPCGPAVDGRAAGAGRVLSNLGSLGFRDESSLVNLRRLWKSHPIHGTIAM